MSFFAISGPKKDTPKMLRHLFERDMIYLKYAENVACFLHTPVLTEVIRVITKEFDLFITSIITDGIGRHEVFSPLTSYNFRGKRTSQVL